MELASSSSVDPVIRAHVTSLISALGGPDHSLPNSPYVLGDDALACLKDLKKWLKAYDQKLGRLEVARTISETSLMTEDLLEILVEWEKDYAKATPNEFRIALACLELMVPLTWPLETEGQGLPKESEVHKTHVARAHRKYKWAILNHFSHTVLVAISRIMIPSLQLSIRERTERDNGILKMCLYLFRNIALIESPEDEEIDDGRTSIITAFNEQKVFGILTALGSGLSGVLSAVDLAVLEVLYAVLRGIEVKTIYNPPVTKVSGGGKPEHPWLALELGATVKASSAPTRHNRFGTMTSLVLEKSKRFTVSGQVSLGDAGSALDQLDKLKKPGRLASRRQAYTDLAERPTIISGEAQRVLASFIRDFIETSFNPLFVSVRKEIERESARVLEAHKVQFLYTVSWFLSARLHQPPEELEDDGFNLVSGVLDHQSLITITKLLRESVENKQSKKMTHAMECLKQIVAVASRMASSDDKNDRDVAGNMISRLFYEESTLDLLASLPNVLKSAAVPQLKTCCDLVCSVLKLLEGFANETSHMFVRSKKRRANQKDGPRKRTASDVREADGDDDDLMDEAQEIARQQAISERAFEFKRFERRFFTQNCVDMFRTVLGTYKELDDQAIKRVISFFHRIFFKREEELLLYRLDFILVLHKCLDPRNGIPRTKSSREEVERFMKHFTRKLATALEERPALYIELLFTKMPDTLFFLKYGHDDVPKKNRQKTPVTENAESAQEEEEEDYGIDDGFIVPDDEPDDDAAFDAMGDKTTSVGNSTMDDVGDNIEDKIMEDMVEAGTGISSIMEEGVASLEDPEGNN